MRIPARGGFPPYILHYLQDARLHAGGRANGDLFPAPLPCHEAKVRIEANQRADGAVARGWHEGHKRRECCADRPGGLPVLRVVRRDGEADLDARLKPPVWSEQHKCGRLEGVVGGHDYPAVIDAALERDQEV